MTWVTNSVAGTKLDMLISSESFYLLVLPSGQTSVTLIMMMICTPITLQSLVEMELDVDCVRVASVDPGRALVLESPSVRELATEREFDGCTVDSAMCVEVDAVLGVDLDSEALESSPDLEDTILVDSKLEPELDRLEVSPVIDDVTDTGVDPDPDDSVHLVVVTVVSSVVLIVLPKLIEETESVCPDRL